MSSDERDQGRKWIESEITKIAGERGVVLDGPVVWHKDFDRMVYWIEVVFGGNAKRWKFSYEQLEDCVNDKNVQRDLKKTIAFFVPDSSAQVPVTLNERVLVQNHGGSVAKSRTLRVFLCHSKVDKPAVRQLYRKLVDLGITPWFDEENLLPGDDWELAIKKEVRTSDVVLVCLSQVSVTTRGFAQKEIRLALDVADEQPEGTIFVIPVRLEECEVPDRLKRWHWVNLFEEKGLAKLMASLKLRASELGIKLASGQ